MSFATAEDVATRLGRTLDATEAATVTDLLKLATGLIQNEARQTLTQVEDDTLTRSGTPEDRVRLPQRPVTEVSSVTLDDAELTEGEDYYVDGDELVRLPASGQSSFALISGSGWGTPDQTLEVVYTHGYDTDSFPETIRGLTIEMAKRAFMNTSGAMMERLGQAQVQYAVQGSAPGLMLTADEANLVRDSFRRTAGTVKLR